jgi:hypothetical protein
MRDQQRAARRRDGRGPSNSAVCGGLIETTALLTRRRRAGQKHPGHDRCITFPRAEPRPDHSPGNWDASKIPILSFRMDKGPNSEPTRLGRDPSPFTERQVSSQQAHAPASCDDTATPELNQQRRGGTAIVLGLLGRGGRWVLTAALGAAIALGVARVLGDLGHKHVPIPAQLDAILAHAATEGLEPVYLREMDLQDTGATARLVVLRPQFDSHVVSRSDELRVYDTGHEQLQLAFAARPLPEPRGVPYHITLLALGSFDHTDREEAILTLDPEYADTQLPRPVALLWNLGTQRYELRALLSHSPSLARVRGFWAVTGPRLDRPINIRLADEGVIRNVGGAWAVAIARSRLATAYPVNKTCNACTGTWEFKTFCLNFASPGLGGYETGGFTNSGRRKHYLARISSSIVISSINRNLQAALRRGYCE